MNIQTYNVEVKLKNAPNPITYEQVLNSFESRRLYHIVFFDSDNSWAIHYVYSMDEVEYIRIF